MKKYIFIAGAFLFFSLAPHALADGFVALAPIPGLTQDVAANTAGLAAFFNNLYKYLIGIAAVLAVIEIIWGGLRIATNQDNVSVITDSKGKIYNAIFGLVLVLSPVLVFSIINPSILNLSVNLPPLDTKSGTLNQTSGTGGTVAQTQAPSTGCTTTRSGPYLETVICASQNYASSYSCQNALSPTISACAVEDSNGNCLDKSVRVYCGKTASVVYYKATHFFGIIPGWDSTVIPRDASTQSAFTSGCAADGGKMDASKSTLSFVTTGLLSNGCPTDSGISFNTSDQYGVICYTENLSCTP